MTAMTWPIDLAEELKELDETYDKIGRAHV